MTDGTPKPYGAGVKQRNQVAMTPEEIAEFLAGMHTLSIATINHDGSIHMVAMWYGFLDGDIAFTSKAKAQKIVNLRRNPTITVMTEEGDTYNELIGVSIHGKGEIIEDPERRFQVAVSVYERHSGPYTDDRRADVEAMLYKREVVRVIPERVVSWDHGKL